MSGSLVDEIPFVTEALLASLRKGQVLEVVFDLRAFRPAVSLSIGPSRAPLQGRVELTHVAFVRYAEGKLRPVVRYEDGYLPLTTRDRARVLGGAR